MKISSIAKRCITRMWAFIREKPVVWKLSNVSRCGLFFIGAFLIICSTYLTINPPLRFEWVANSQGQFDLTKSAPDLTTFMLSMFLVGSGMLALATNGIRVGSVSRDGVFGLLSEPRAPRSSAGDDEENAEDGNANEHGSNSDEIDEVGPTGPDTPTGEPTRMVENESGETFLVYRVTDIPLHVIARFMIQHPAAVEALSAVSWVLRRKAGKGSHSWFFQLIDGKMLKVSFSGRPKVDRN